jgi:hypothetical protein
MPETPFDLDVDGGYDATWIPEHSWTWKEDDTWIFAGFWNPKGLRYQEVYLVKVIPVHSDSLTSMI